MRPLIVWVFLAVGNLIYCRLQVLPYSHAGTPTYWEGVALLTLVMSQWNITKFFKLFMSGPKQPVGYQPTNKVGGGYQPGKYTKPSHPPAPRQPRRGDPDWIESIDGSGWTDPQ
jgi:hypothetical protein